MSNFSSLRVLCSVVVLVSAVAAGTPNATGDRGTKPPSAAPWKIERSVVVARGQWTLATDDAAIVIDGARGVVLDLGSAHFQGAATSDDPTRARGIGILVRNSRDIVVRAGELSGYRTAVRVEDSVGVTLEALDVHDLFAAPLASSDALASPADQLERRDPRAFEQTGAAFAVLRSSGVKLRNCRARRGTIGIAVVDAPAISIVDGDIAHQSAFGIALWRSPEATVAHTRVEACARGSAGEFWRGGQGSAGLLVVDSPGARVGECAITRCGTGVVALGASAGLTLVRTDVSWPIEHGVELVGIDDANLIELFARGAGANALRLEGGSKARIVECMLEGARGSAVSLEGASETSLVRNWIAGSTVGLSAVDARGVLLAADGFGDNGLDWALDRCAGLMTVDNVFDPENSLHVADTEAQVAEHERARVRGIGGAMPSGRLQGCEVVDLDVERLGALEAAVGALDKRFEGKNAVRKSVEPEQPLVFDRFGPWDPRGQRARPLPRPKGGLFGTANWDAAWFSWADGPDPRGVSEARAQWRELSLAPLARRTVGAWLTPFGEGERSAELPSDKLGLVARTTLSVEGGRYRVNATSDDGVALRVDGVTVLENWTWHGATVDRAEFVLAPGGHVFELEYFQVDGPSALELELDRLGP
ncbi:MAG: right-handed parallel beta-helix repeat-containing protein [Planctomycetes bacterium]|nr:right-handed parallel beta-helix repeat-containing protein [Planctomycetota bacterium]